MSVETDLEVALRAARAGAAVGLRFFAALGGLSRELKADGSTVTEADRAVEVEIRGVLAAARPADAVLGEEAGQTGEAGRRWIVDPIDGTAMFVAGDDRWLVLLALEVDGVIVAGVAAVPAQGHVYWAARGGGAYLDGAPIGVGASSTVARLGVVPEGDQLGPAELQMLAPLEAATSRVPWRTHPALLVASGELDVAVQTRGQTWDFAATKLIVEEAGGCFSKLDGGTYPSAGPSVYARTAQLRDTALRLLNG